MMAGTATAAAAAADDDDDACDAVVLAIKMWILAGATHCYQ